MRQAIILLLLEPAWVAGGAVTDPSAAAGAQSLPARPRGSLPQGTSKPGPLTCGTAGDSHTWQQCQQSVDARTQVKSSLKQRLLKKNPTRLNSQRLQSFFEFPGSSVAEYGRV